MRSTENTYRLEAAEAEEYIRASKRALYLLGGRDYCSAELCDKLRSNYSDVVCERVIGRMQEYGYLDDEAYAKKLARSQIIVKKHGKQRALFEMTRKGLPRELCENALAEYGCETLREEIAELVRKKYIGKITDDSENGRHERQTVIAALARRGYGYGDIKAAMENVLEEYSDEE